MKLAVLLSSPVLLSACANTTVATVDPLKTTLRDVCISRDDQLTEGTAQAIERVNRQFGTMFDRKSQCPKSTGKKATPAPATYQAPNDPKTS
jgi:hypothetical protein